MKSHDLRMVAVPDQMKPLVERLAVGVSNELVDQLIDKSRQPHIVTHAPNDAKKRFVNRATFDAWLTPDCTIHWLLGPNNDLAGIIWYRKKPWPLAVTLPETPDETFAIRLYEGYVGQRLSTPFLKLSLRVVVETKRARGESVTAMWLETDADNAAALASYTKLGYREIAHHEQRVFMVMDSADVCQAAGLLPS